MMPGEFKWGPCQTIGRPATYRQEIIESMARALRAAGTASDERDAIRSLFHDGYAMFDIANYLPDARALVFQEIVAEEMSKP